MIAALGALWIAAGVSGCQCDDHTPRHRVASESRCPSGFVVDPKRTERLEADVRGDPEVAKLLRQGTYTVCYGEIGASSVTDQSRVLLLRASTADTELACRMAHLLVHLSDPLPPLDPGDCDAWIEEVAVRERTAHDLETRLRAQRGLAPQSPGVDRLLEQYSERCQRAAQ